MTILMSSGKSQGQAFMYKQEVLRGLATLLIESMCWGEGLFYKNVTGM